MTLLFNQCAHVDALAMLLIFFHLFLKKCINVYEKFKFTQCFYCLLISMLLFCVYALCYDNVFEDSCSGC